MMNTIINLLTICLIVLTAGLSHTHLAWPVWSAEPLIASLVIIVFIIGCLRWALFSRMLLSILIIHLVQQALCPRLSSQIAISLFWLTNILSALAYAYDHYRRQNSTWGRLFCIISLISYGVGFLMRWQETYATPTPHIPMTTLYEVLLLLAGTILVLYLYLEERMRTQQLGVFALSLTLVIQLFTIWYAYTHQAYLITPLPPALRSYWLALHVPMNFIGYGLFALAAVISLAALFKKTVTSALSIEQMDIIIATCIRWGLLFFTIAILLGALWAAETWGSYWQWDPKETWSLIVWLNYAAWLHTLRTPLPRRVRLYWSSASFFITAFAFLGVNIYLSGLHTYGHL